MPRILIREQDNTSPGTPPRYADYSVLVAGFAKIIGGKTDAEIAKLSDEELTSLKSDLTDSDDLAMLEKRAALRDSNGAYVFDSAADFIKALGVMDPEVKNDDETITFEHYGNAMARELLNLGFRVIYKPVSSMDDLLNADTWNVFKDRATYDFRFISHGLLTSATTGGNSAIVNTINSRIAYLNRAISVLDGYENIAKNEISDNTTDAAAERAARVEELIDDDRATVATNGYYMPTWLSKQPLVIDDYPDEYEYKYGNKDDILASIEHETTYLSTIITNNYANVLSTAHINAANKLIADVAAYSVDKNGKVWANGRGDCIALIELDENAYTQTDYFKAPEEAIALAVNDLGSITEHNGSFCAITVPSVYYRIDGKIKKFPASFHYLACFASALGSGYAEWYATAGYNRGVSSYFVDHTSVTLGEIAINALEPRNITKSTDPLRSCNVIANFKGSYYLWGNRTAFPLGYADGGDDLVASHFLNIKQLTTTIKKQLYVACRRFTFDPNSDTLWVNFVSAIRPTLELMKADQGIRDYKIIKEFTDKKATLKAKIRIIPIEAVEDFDLEIHLDDEFNVEVTD